jgi:hypothetical protein
VQAEILPQANGGVGADGSVSAVHEFGLENFSRVDRKPFLLSGQA